MFSSKFLPFFALIFLLLAMPTFEMEKGKEKADGSEKTNEELCQRGIQLLIEAAETLNGAAENQTDAATDSPAKRQKIETKKVAAKKRGGRRTNGKKQTETSAAASAQNSDGAATGNSPRPELATNFAVDQPIEAEASADGIVPVDLSAAEEKDNLMEFISLENYDLIKEIAIPEQSELLSLLEDKEMEEAVPNHIQELANKFHQKTLLTERSDDGGGRASSSRNISSRTQPKTVRQINANAQKVDDALRKAQEAPGDNTSVNAPLMNSWPFQFQSDKSILEKMRSGRSAEVKLNAYRIGKAKEASRANYPIIGSRAGDTPNANELFDVRMIPSPKVGQGDPKERNQRTTNDIRMQSQMLQFSKGLRMLAQQHSFPSPSTENIGVLISPTIGQSPIMESRGEHLLHQNSPFSSSNLSSPSAIRRQTPITEMAIDSPLLSASLIAARIGEASVSSAAWNTPTAESPQKTAQIDELVVQVIVISIRALGKPKHPIRFGVNVFGTGPNPYALDVDVKRIVQLISERKKNGAFLQNNVMNKIKEMGNGQINAILAEIVAKNEQFRAKIGPNEQKGKELTFLFFFDRLYRKLSDILKWASLKTNSKIREQLLACLSSLNEKIWQEFVLLSTATKQKMAFQWAEALNRLEDAIELTNFGIWMLFPSVAIQTFVIEVRPTAQNDFIYKIGHQSIEEEINDNDLAESAEHPTRTKLNKLLGHGTVFEKLKGIFNRLADQVKQCSVSMEHVRNLPTKAMIMLGIMRQIRDELKNAEFERIKVSQLATERAKGLAIVGKCLAILDAKVEAFNQQVRKELWDVDKMCRKLMESEDGTK